jgi:hypothetical protein
MRNFRRLLQIARENIRDSKTIEPDNNVQEIKP